MKFEVLTIEHDAQRYVTIGDYWEDDDGLHVRISRLGDWRYEGLVLVHEVVELLLCKVAGVNISDVDAWDMSHGDLDEPGEDPRAPYHRQHMAADAIERAVAWMMGVDWNDYTSKVDSLSCS